MRQNRYARKCAHKRALKKRHAVKWARYDINLDEQLERDDYFDTLVRYPHAKYLDHRNGGYQYWDQSYISGSRKYAKQCTNRKIRSKYRDLIANEHPDNIPSLNGSDYEKEFDYWWTIF